MLSLLSAAWRVCQGKSGAFDAYRKLADSGKDIQVAETVLFCFLVELARHHRMKFLKQVLGLFFALAFDGLRHHARRGFRDRTARAFKPNFFHELVFEIQIDSQLIAAEWIVAFSRVIRGFELAKISRLLVMVEDYLLVKFAQFRSRQLRQELIQQGLHLLPRPPDRDKSRPSAQAYLVQQQPHLCLPPRGNYRSVVFPTRRGAGRAQGLSRAHGSWDFPEKLGRRSAFRCKVEWARSQRSGSAPPKRKQCPTRKSNHHRARGGRIADPPAHRLPTWMTNIDRVDERVTHQAANQAHYAVRNQNSRRREAVAGNRCALRHCP